jgi:hypothetical protein
MTDSESTTRKLRVKSWIHYILHIRLYKPILGDGHPPKKGLIHLLYIRILIHVGGVARTHQFHVYSSFPFLMRAMKDTRFPISWNTSWIWLVPLLLSHIIIMPNKWSSVTPLFLVATAFFHQDCPIRTGWRLASCRSWTRLRAVAPCRCHFGVMAFARWRNSQSERCRRHRAGSKWDMV